MSARGAIAPGAPTGPAAPSAPAAPGASAAPAAPIRWHWLGRAPYRRVWADQLALRERVWAGGEGAVLLCEHPPVITLGHSAKEVNILDAGDVPIVRTERGGDVTYHGPGQLMIYAVVRVPGVVELLACIGGAIAAACAALGVHGAAWRQKPAGVWVGDAKLAACGIHVARGVSVHGFALDVDTPAEAWARIRACGLDAPHASISRRLAGGSSGGADSGSRRLAGGSSGGADSGARRLAGSVIGVAEAAAEVGPRVAAALTAMR